MDKVYVHHPEYREAKPVQSDPTQSVASLFRLENRTVIVTGGSGAIGATLAAAILEAGADVMVLDLPEKPVEKFWTPVQAAASASTSTLTYHSCDVTSEDSVNAVFASITSTIRHPLRGLVSCAGAVINGPALDFSVAHWRKMLDINLLGTFTVAQAFAKAVTAAEPAGPGASIVLTASISGHVSQKGTDNSGYCAAKAGVLQLARSLAAEWGNRKGVPLIRVNTVSPGYVHTEALEVALVRPGFRDAVEGDAMMGRLGKPHEFRAPVVFMLGDGASFVTGADLKVDGGMTAW